MRPALQLHPWDLSIIKLDTPHFDSIGASAFVAISITPDECSAVCETARVPEHVTDRHDGWKCISVVGPLDFSLTGILAGISRVLAEEKISIFAVSTFDTDYVLVPADRVAAATQALVADGYRFVVYEGNE